jgi:hypothetical protein
MDIDHGEGLGHGVFASPSTGGELIVTSTRHDLGWRPAEGKTPGTAVMWQGRPYEVVDRFEAGQGERWVLRGWNEATAMRRVFKLDADSVSEIAERSVSEVRGKRVRRSTFLLVPLLGLAPARVQKQWADEWAFNAGRATVVSAMLEMLVGAMGIVQLAAAAFGGEFFMPRVLALPGPLLFAVGFARLAMVFADGEPVGSPIGLPFLLLAPKPMLKSDKPMPTLRSFDETNGVLELVSPILRRDWDRDGTLRFRNQTYRLRKTSQEGRSWVSLFERCEGGEDPGRELRLAPPVEAKYLPRRAQSKPPAILVTTLVTAGVTLGPRRDQELWGKHLGIHPMWLTLMGSTAELVGGVANLKNDLGPEASLLVFLDFFLVGEGLLRTGSALSGRPLGSLFGLILRPLYHRWLPDEKS